MINRFKKNLVLGCVNEIQLRKAFSFFNKSFFLLKKDVRVQLLFQFGFDLLCRANKDMQLKYSEGEMQGGTDDRRTVCAAHKSSEEQIEHTELSLPELSGCSLQPWASHLIICPRSKCGSSVGAACVPAGRSADQFPAAPVCMSK